jgi:hypothetical protein
LRVMLGGSPSEYQATPGCRDEDCYDVPLVRLRSTSEVCDQSEYRPIG